MFFTKLFEVGKKISKKNAERLRKAMQEITDLLAQVDTEESLSEAERSQRDRASLLQKAVRAKYPESYGYVVDIFDATLIYTDYEGYWQCSYAVAEDGSVSLGDPVEVIPHMTYDPAPGGVMERFAGFGDSVPLFESAIDVTAHDGAPKWINRIAEAQLSEATAQIKLIDPGWGSSGYYSPEMLKRDGPKAFPRGTHMYLDHPTESEKNERPENSVERLAAVLETDAAWNAKGPAGAGLYAQARIGRSHETLIKDFSQDIGVSISAGGVRQMGEAEGRKGYIITALDSRESNPSNSVDFVTLPGRGGEIVQLFEAAGRVPSATKPKETNEMTEEQIKALVAESQKPLVDRVTAAEATTATLTTENARLRETLALQGAKTFVAERLAKITMPAVTRQRLTESLPNRATLKDGVLDEAALGAIVDQAAKDEMAYLGAATPGGVRGVGASAPVTEALSVDKLAESFVAMGLSPEAAKIAAAGRTV